MFSRSSCDALYDLGKDVRHSTSQLSQRLSSIGLIAKLVLFVSKNLVMLSSKSFGIKNDVTGYMSQKYRLAVCFMLAALCHAYKHVSRINMK